MTTTSKLALEIQDIADKKVCGENPPYSANPLEGTGLDSSGFPYIDQVIYREWNSSIVFKQTSTVFHRVEGRIKWYKSKVDNNQGNPIFINGELNEDFWESINDCCEYVSFRQEFTYNGGPQTFELNYTPDRIFLVSANGYGPFFSSDYSVSGNAVTILPPNVLSEGSEIIIWASYGSDQIINNPAVFSQLPTPVGVIRKAGIDENGNVVEIDYVSVPETPTSTGTKGDRAYDATYVYECVATDTWVRYERDLTVWDNS